MIRALAALALLPALASATPWTRLLVEVDDDGARVVAASPGRATSSDAATADPRWLHAEEPVDGRWTGELVLRERAVLALDVPGDVLGRTLPLRIGERTLDLTVPLSPAATPSLPRDGLEVRTLVDSGPSDARQDVVFLAEGYTEDERERFFDDVTAALSYLALLEPHDTTLGLVNVHGVFTPSAESGADHPEAAPPTTADTALHCTYGAFDIDRLIVCDDAAVLALASESPGDDVRVVLVNDPTYGGSGGVTYATAYTGDLMEQTVAHEMGHSDAGLADEYLYGGPAPAGALPVPNCSPEAASTPWDAWRDGDSVDAFAGCSWTDWFRPTDDQCLMNVLQDRFCPACRERVVTTVWSHLDRIVVEASPTEATLGLGDEITFTVDTVPLDGTELAWAWWLDGQLQPETGPSLTLQRREIAHGDHDLRVEVGLDTPFVRGARAPAMDDSVEFAVTAEGCGCYGGTPRGAWLLLFLLPLGRRRVA